jgi:hypothetical protein
VRWLLPAERQLPMTRPGSTPRLGSKRTRQCLTLQRLARARARGRGSCAHFGWAIFGGADGLPGSRGLLALLAGHKKGSQSTRPDRPILEADSSSKPID